jgi:hypothetical protein
MLAVFASYVAFIWIKYGVQPSISDSYYKLPEKEKILFTLFCWGFAFPAIIIGSVMSNTPIMFFAGSGILLVGAKPDFRNGDRLFHLIAAYVAVALSQLSIAVDFHMYWLNISFVTIAGTLFLIKKFISNHVWWAEIVAFLSICVALGIETFVKH